MELELLELIELDETELAESELVELTELTELEELTELDETELEELTEDDTELDTLESLKLELTELELTELDEELTPPPLGSLGTAFFLMCLALVKTLGSQTLIRPSATIEILPKSSTNMPLVPSVSIIQKYVPPVYTKIGSLSTSKILFYLFIIFKLFLSLLSW
jgi:hypothetical protein